MIRAVAPPHAVGVLSAVIIAQAIEKRREESTKAR
jgi:hypothetical protein